MSVLWDEWGMITDVAVSTFIVFSFSLFPSAPNNVASSAIVKSASDAAFPVINAKGKPVIRSYTPSVVLIPGPCLRFSIVPSKPHSVQLKRIT